MFSCIGGNFRERVEKPDRRRGEVAKPPAAAETAQRRRRREPSLEEKIPTKP
jgi:hypothetical protein